MLQILPLTPKIQTKVEKYNLQKKLAKAIILIANNPFHPGLHTELLEPKSNGYHSFRIDLKYRGIFIMRDDGFIQIVAITVHYH